MRAPPRLVVVPLLGLALALGLAAGGLAALGRARWGDAGWYFRGDPDYRLRCGQRALRRGDPARAARVAVLLEADGHRDQAALLGGEVLFRRGKEAAEGRDPAGAPRLLRKAEAQLNRVRDRGAPRLEAAALLGHCYLRLQRPNDAKNAFEFVLHHQPDDADAHRGLAAAYFDLGALPSATEHLQKVTELDPRDGRPYRLLGLIYKNLQREEEAADCYRKALERDLPRGSPDQGPDRVRRELAECLAAARRHAEALDVLSDLHAPRDEAAAVEALRGECLRAVGRSAEARAALDRALAEYPGSPDLLRARAELHAAEGEPAAAAALLEQALGIDRHDSTARVQLARAYRTLGREADAADQQRLADETRKLFDGVDRLGREAAARPRDAEVRLRLAGLCAKLDRPEDAAKWRRAAAACTPAAPVLPDESPGVLP
jgi:tetratricopeptide (TPR) repeat protein